MTAKQELQALDRSIELNAESVFYHAIALSNGKSHQQAATDIKRDVHKFVKQALHDELSAACIEFDSTWNHKAVEYCKMRLKQLEEGL